MKFSTTYWTGTSTGSAVIDVPGVSDADPFSGVRHAVREALVASGAPSYLILERCEPVAGGPAAVARVPRGAAGWVEYGPALLARVDGTSDAAHVNVAGRAVGYAGSSKLRLEILDGSARPGVMMEAGEVGLLRDALSAWLDDHRETWMDGQ